MKEAATNAAAACSQMGWPEAFSTVGVALAVVLFFWVLFR